MISFCKATAVQAQVPTWGVFLNEYEQEAAPHRYRYSCTGFDPVMMNIAPVCGRFGYETGHNGGRIQPYLRLGSKEFTVEDSAFGFVVMENGATIIQESSWALNTLQEGEAIATLAVLKAVQICWTV